MSFPRSTGTPRGEARRAALLAAVADDVAAHGLAEFTLRRAARAAGTTHKVLLYHFAGVDELLAAVVAELRSRRIDRGLAGVLAGPDGAPTVRVRAIWAVLVGAEETALLQAVGLAVQDPERHGDLVRGATDEYLAALRSLLPATWSDRRRDEVAELVLAGLRGLLVARRTGADDARVDAGLTALERAVERELALP